MLTTYYFCHQLQVASFTLAVDFGQNRPENVDEKNLSTSAGSNSSVDNRSLKFCHQHA